jgi:hypothetical protein
MRQPSRVRTTASTDNTKAVAVPTDGVIINAQGATPAINAAPAAENAVKNSTGGRNSASIG